MKYLTDYTGKDDDLSLAEQSYGLPPETHAQNFFLLHDIFYANLEKDGLISLYRDVELPLSDVLFDMEVAGVKVDVGTSAVFEKKYREEAEKITEDIYAQAGEKFNLNSPAQLGKVLFDDVLDHGKGDLKNGSSRYPESDRDTDRHQKYQPHCPLETFVSDLRRQTVYASVRKAAELRQT